MKRVVWLILLAAAAWAGFQPAVAASYTRTEDVIYGRKFGTALTLDVFQPEKTNGLAIIYMVSGGWFSHHEHISPPKYQPFLDRGYTVFAVVHGSQPKFIVTEIVGDIHRAVRFIRYNAARYGVDPNRLGITGASAGGHLTLTMATRGTRETQTQKTRWTARAARCNARPASFRPPISSITANPARMPWGLAP